MTASAELHQDRHRTDSLLRRALPGNDRLIRGQGAHQKARSALAMYRSGMWLCQGQTRSMTRVRSLKLPASSLSNSRVQRPRWAWPTSLAPISANPMLRARPVMRPHSRSRRLCFPTLFDSRRSILVIRLAIPVRALCRRPFLRICCSRIDLT